jgi:AcrR family transcriptional regulator
MKTPNTRQRILDAAQRLIEKDGSSRLTTKEIAREAKCAEGTLFKYFERKEDLCLAVVLENAPKFRGEISQARAGQRTVAENLVDIAMAALDFFEKLLPLATSLFADIDLLKRHRKVMAAEKRGPQDVFKLLGIYIQDEQQLNRVGSQVKSASATALLLGPCFQRAFIRHVMGKDLVTSTDREFVKSLVATLIDGLHTDKEANRRQE